jgi:hypothetical protein
VVYEISAVDKQGLDEKEGLGNGYEQKNVPIVADNGEGIEAIMYYATNTDTSLRPYDWYKEHVLLGAREHGLPAEYIAAIEVVSPVPDPNAQRHEMELAVYR